MAGQGAEDQVVALSQRVRALEHERWHRTVSDAYGRFYAPVALGAVMLTFLPILEDVVEKNADGTTMTYRYGTLWEMAGNTGGEPALLGILLAVGFATLLVTASVRVTTSAHPIGISVTALILLLMLIGKPGTADPTPDLAAGGLAGVALSVVAMVLGAVHAVHVYQRSRQKVMFQV